MKESKTRKDLRMAAAVHVRDADHPDAGPWLTRDISPSGLFLLAPNRWAVGDVVPLILEHGEAELRIRAKVTQAHEEGVGFAFENTQPVFRAAITEIMNDQFEFGVGWTERRGEPRWAVERSARWRAFEEFAEHAATVTDINTSGAALESITLPDKGDEIYLLLPVEGMSEDGPQYTGFNGCRVRVVSRSGYGFGVEFLQPTDEFRDFVLALVGKPIQ